MSEIAHALMVAKSDVGASGEIKPRAIWQDERARLEMTFEEYVGACADCGKKPGFTKEQWERMRNNRSLK